METMDNKDIKIYADLYNYQTVVLMLKKRFDLFSIRRSSEPTEGSPTYPTAFLDHNADNKIQRVILHRNNEVTIITDLGWLKFICPNKK